MSITKTTKLGIAASQLQHAISHFIESRKLVSAITLAGALLIVFPAATAQQTPNSSDKQIQLYMQVMRGERAFDSLTQAEKSKVISLQRLMASSCGNLNGKCQEVCEAANQLRDAANDLARCASKHDYGNDCRRKFRDTRDAFDQYESSVSSASGDCS